MDFLKFVEVKIANLVKIIGQNELIRCIGGVTKTIEFCLQRDIKIVSKVIND